MDLMAQQQQQELPVEMWMEILRRLSLGNIIKSKLVWRHLIESPEFSALFLKNLSSKSTQYQLEFPPILRIEPVLKLIPKPPKILQTETLEISDVNMLAVKINLAYICPIASTTVNGLILLAHKFPRRREQQLWICNPITREYLTIPNPPHYIRFKFGMKQPGMQEDAVPENGNYSYGFGVSRGSNEYKLVWISAGSEWHVYTLGGRGGDWRSLPGPRLGPPSPSDKFWMNTECAFLGGNLYWLDPQMEASRFWCLDLETEVFTTFSAPPCQPPQGQGCARRRRLVCVLEERLCLCDVVVVENEGGIGNDEIVVWLMSNDLLGDWRKEYTIRGGYEKSQHGCLYPIKVLEDGGMLLGRVGEPDILLYSTSNSPINGHGATSSSSSSLRLLYPHDPRLVRSAKRRDWCPRAAHYTPSFLPLKTLFPDMDIQSLSLH